MIIKFATFGCLHAPITHSGYFDWLIQQLEEFQPDVVVNLGDWYEGLAGSRHSRDPRHNWSLFDEHEAVAEQARRINDACPDAHKVWLAGNHDDNAFGVHADRIPPDLRQVCHYQNSAVVMDALKGWRIKGYSHGSRFYLGPVSFGHGCPVADSSGKDESYLYGVPYGLDIRAHTHRPEAITQARERKVPLPYCYANVGTGADWDKMYYMERLSKALWGRGMIVGETAAPGVAEGKKQFAKKVWSAELRIHSWASPNKMV